MMRRRMMRQMMYDRCCGPHEGHGRHGAQWDITPEQELAFLEEYQRDLEEALADIADRVKAVKKAMDEADGDETPD